MSFKTAFFLVFLFNYLHLSGQQMADSVQLEEVRIYGIPLKEYAAGSKILAIDSSTLEWFESSNVAEVLTAKSPLYFKTYGTGMVSTVSFRGTSSSHTAVFWNGVNINSASLGQIDFSLIPVSAAENLSIHFGSSSSLYGSGAIGGSIQLYSTPDWLKQFKASLFQEIGSFGRSYTSLSSRYGNGTIETKTNLFYKVAENNFPYEIDGINGPNKVKQKNAAISQLGLIQDINYRIASNEYLTLNFWLSNLEREVQPSITSSSNRDKQVDQNIRIVANYHLNNSLGHFNPRLAYLYDVLEFNGSPSFTTRYIAAFQHEYRIDNSLKISSGVDYTHITADVSGYGKEVRENRSDVFALIKYEPWNRFLISANLRQSFITGFRAPFAPSLGVEFNFFTTEEYKLYWKSSMSKSYRIPTLNDRYWSPGGNPDLKSETGKNFETGLQFLDEDPRSMIELEITGYTNLVTDWIIWLPNGDHWSPNNIRKVNAKGLEVSSLHRKKYGLLEYSIGVQYAYTLSTNNNKEDKDYGKQLMYVPVHNGSFHVEGRVLNWHFNINNTYTGSRSTTIESLDPFWLSQLTIGKTLLLGDHSLACFIKISNLFDKDYFNYESRAMPGRNYNLSVKYTFNK